MFGRYGAPISALIAFRSSVGSDQLDIRVELVDKQPTRLPEATWLQFSAAQQEPSPPLTYELNKLGGWVDPLQVVDGGAKSLQGVAPDGVSLRISARKHANGHTPRLSVTSLDSAVVRFDAPYPTPTPIFRQPDIAGNGAHFALHMNTWNSECSASPSPFVAFKFIVPDMLSHSRAPLHAANYPFWWPYVGAKASMVYRFRLAVEG